MDQELENEIMYRMMPYLTNEQAMMLKKTLDTINEDSDLELTNTEIVNQFFHAKSLEGLSERTLQYYRNTIDAMLLSIGKDVRAVTTEDLRGYLTEYQNKNGASNTTVDNVRRNLSSFFRWMEDENYILKSPVRRIHKVRTAKTVKETYSDEDIERMRDSCTNLRDLALIDLLATTGMRVGELVLLNREDIDFQDRECIVFGKGDKERVVYLDAKAKLHLLDYLVSRTDDNPALIVSLRKPHQRLKIGGVETMLRKKGLALGIQRVHPHKFRRTMATMAIDKGMPIEQLQQILGHQKIDTTMHYAMVKQSNVKNAHRKYIG